MTGLWAKLVRTWCEIGISNKIIKIILINNLGKFRSTDVWKQQWAAGIELEMKLGNRYIPENVVIIQLEKCSLGL